MLKIHGMPASQGFAIGPAFVFARDEIRIDQHQISDPQAELSRLKNAKAEAAVQMDALIARARNEISEEQAGIFEAHKAILEDEELAAMVADSVREHKLNVEAAWANAIEFFSHIMEELSDEYFRARAADIRDVGQRVLRLLTGRAGQDLSALTQPSLILARDLTPSDTINLDRALVLGFCTEAGGPTSHTAILAKALGLPAVVAAGSGLAAAESGCMVIVDGGAGDVILDPDASILAEYQARRRADQIVRNQQQSQAHKPAVTTDGHRVEIVANIGGVNDARTALESGAEGVGLFRTEFVYLERTSAPGEDEQERVYREVLEAMGGRPVVVRTLDIGGDKEIPYLELEKEANPFLGWRAIRLCLDKPEIFRTQLRALLRAGTGHDLRIMFPMIATVSEVRQAKTHLAAVAAELRQAGIAFCEVPQVGIMVEIPSAVVMADRFIPEVDFFSIGTNDLTQYTMAAERTNEKVAHLGDACHPAVLRQIARVIEVAHVGGRWVGVCGELAGDLDAVPLLLGLGLDEFSMAPSSIPAAKALIRQWSFAAAQPIARQALELENAEEVRAFVRGKKL